MCDLEKRNTNKEKEKRNRGFPYKSRVCRECGKFYFRGKKLRKGCCCQD